MYPSIVCHPLQQCCYDICDIFVVTYSVCDNCCSVKPLEDDDRPKPSLPTPRPQPLSSVGSGSIPPPSPMAAAAAAGTPQVPPPPITAAAAAAGVGVVVPPSPRHVVPGQQTPKAAGDVLASPAVQVCRFVFCFQLVFCLQRICC